MSLSKIAFKVLAALYSLLSGLLGAISTVIIREASELQRLSSI
jgi:hypothetical protein